MIFISQPLIDWGLKERVASPEKIVKIYSGIELDNFQPATQTETNRLRQKWGLNKEDAVVGIVSKLWDGKGHAVLIRAFERLIAHIPNARLVIVGEGYLMDQLRSQVSSNGLSKSVVFTGFQMNVRDIVACFDVAVLPSFFEGMGRVLLEAMAMEKPVIGTRVGGIPDLIDDGVNGYLVEPGDEYQLSESISTILRNPSMACQMGRSGLNKIQTQFSADHMVQAIETVYCDLLMKKDIKIAA